MYMGSKIGMERRAGASACGIRKPCVRAAAWLPHSIFLFRQLLILQLEFFRQPGG
jgi:hypothetical protein